MSYTARIPAEITRQFKKKLVFGILLTTKSIFCFFLPFKHSLAPNCIIPNVNECFTPNSYNYTLVDTASPNN